MSSARPGVIVLTSEQARTMIGAPPTGEVSLALMVDGSIMAAHPEVQPHYLRLCSVTGYWLISRVSPGCKVAAHIGRRGDSGVTPG